MTIGRKLTLAFSGVLCVLFAFSIVMLLLISGINTSLARTVDVSAKKLFLIGELDTARADLRASVRGTLIYAFAKKPDLMEANRQKTIASAEHATVLLTELKPLLQTEEGRQKADVLASEFQTWKEKFEIMAELCRQGKPDEGEVFGTRETKSIAEAAAADISSLRDLQFKLLEEDKKEAQARTNFAKTAATISILCSIVLGVVVLWVITNITRTVGNIASDLAQGSEQVASAAAQISSSAQSLAQGASEQAASLEETSSSTVEVVSMTNRNAENTKNTMALMQGTENRIKDGNERLLEMEQSMEHITSAAQKISAILKTIDEIAFQTNILALNAAVEAARAGEAGMGFAVVADEVRNLAQRCAQAAKNTRELIDDSIRSSQNGKESLDKVAKAIAGITKEAERMKVLVQEVNLGSQEQAERLQHISRAVSEMEQVTQRNASGAEESAAAGEQLTAQSQSLHGLVKTLAALVQKRSGERVVVQANSIPHTTASSHTTPLPLLQKSVASTRDPEWIQ